MFMLLMYIVNTINLALSMWHILFLLHLNIFSLQKLTTCISDIRTWMVTNKLKINDSKTEFIIVSSPNSKTNFQDLNLSNSGCGVSASLKAKTIGVIFDSYLDIDSLAIYANQLMFI